MKNTEENVARLKGMMTSPMSAAQHAAIMREKIGQRELAEDIGDAGPDCPDAPKHMKWA